MILRKRHEGNFDVMKHIIIQINDSLPFARQWVPGNIGSNEPEYLFDLLKSHTVFAYDPPKDEVLQSMQTLMTNDNIWGVPGAGDCDCFVITSCACFIVCQMPFRIVLCGRSGKEPVHIYSKVYDYDKNKFVTFDLTNDYYGQERYYPIKQIIKLNKK